MNIGQLKEAIKDLPDSTQVCVDMIEFGSILILLESKGLGCLYPDDTGFVTKAEAEAEGLKNFKENAFCLKVEY